MSLINKNFSKLSLFNKTFFQNDNLLKLVFDFCGVEDILSLSLVNKRFYYLTKSHDYKFLAQMEKEFFSDYSNYE